jgi:hypothetical protein
MSQKPTKHNRIIDFISYTAIGYIVTFNTDWFSTKRIVDSLIVGLAATLLRILIDPKVDAWMERLKKKRKDRKNTQNSN